MPYVSPRVGAQGLLGAAYTTSLATAAERLIPQLVARNTASYLATMRTYAKALRAPLPTAITDPDVRAALTARAQVSAESIVRTRAQRRAALNDQHTRVDAQDLFATWQKQQQVLIDTYEAGAAAAQAHIDFVTHNVGNVTGHEWIEPQTTAGLNDACDHAIAQGHQPLGSIVPAPPYHPRCTHSVASSIERVGTSPLWLGDGTRYVSPRPASAVKHRTMK